MSGLGGTSVGASGETFAGSSVETSVEGRTEVPSWVGGR